MSDREDEILQEIERQSRAATERVRELCRERGREDLVVEMDANLKEVRTGRAQARGIWHALSEPQRRVLRLAASHKRLRRTPGSRHRYDAVGGPADAEGNVSGLATVRNLLARDLLLCDGGAFDPEAAVIISEHGRFVLAVITPSATP